MTHQHLYKTPLGHVSPDVEALAHWNRLADAIASPGWTHHSTDDRCGALIFMSARPFECWLPATVRGGLETIHVEHALWLYERIYGRPFSENP